MTLAMFWFISLAFIAATIVAIVSGFLTLACSIVICILMFWMCKDIISGQREKREKEAWQRQVSHVSKRSDEELQPETHYEQQQ